MWVVAALAGALLLAGCEDTDCSSGNCPDATPCRQADVAAPADVVPGEGRNEPDVTADQAAPSTCMMGKVTCKAGEEEAYGLCVENLEVPMGSGTFEMGKNGAGDAAPARKVTVSAFALDRTEVTNRQYAACVACGQCSLPMRDGSLTGREPYFLNPEFDDYPVVQVTWEQAATFCEGLGKHLPTEAQWEIATRGIGSTTYAWGNTAPEWDSANLAGFKPDTDKVGQYPAGASPAGMLDLIGNVWEWTQDTYYKDAYSWLEAADPVAPEGDALVKVVRGGGFATSIQDAAAWVRMPFEAEAHMATIGFRCAR
jgi:formylglycine-generating enzyme required for sulfatase activity